MWSYCRIEQEMSGCLVYVRIATDHKVSAVRHAHNWEIIRDISNVRAGVTSGYLSDYQNRDRPQSSSLFRGGAGAEWSAVEFPQVWYRHMIQPERELPLWTYPYLSFLGHGFAKRLESGS